MCWFAISVSDCMVVSFIVFIEEGGRRRSTVRIDGFLLGMGTVLQSEKQ